MEIKTKVFLFFVCVCIYVFKQYDFQLVRYWEFYEKPFKIMTQDEHNIIQVYSLELPSTDHML